MVFWNERNSRGIWNIVSHYCYTNQAKLGLWSFEMNVTVGQYDIKYHNVATQNRPHKA